MENPISKRSQKTIDRFEELENYDFKNYWTHGWYFAGVDEVGRGCLAGPLVVGGVVLDPLHAHRLVGVDDSKKLTASKREAIDTVIRECALAWSIGTATPDDVDKEGITGALKSLICDVTDDLADQMHVAKPSSGIFKGLLIDGSKLVLDHKNKDCFDFLVKGDSKSLSVACASIMAKVWRDKIMTDLAKAYPVYGFEKNKGYGSSEHMEAIDKHGPCPIHRYSFAPVKGRWEREK